MDKALYLLWYYCFLRYCSYSFFCAQALRMLFIQSHALCKFACTVIHIARARERTCAHLTTNQEKAFSLRKAKADITRLSEQFPVKTVPGTDLRYSKIFSACLPPLATSTNIKQSHKSNTYIFYFNLRTSCRKRWVSRQASCSGCR